MPSTTKCLTRGAASQKLRRPLTSLHPRLQVRLILLEHFLLLVGEKRLHFVRLLRHQLASLCPAGILIETLILHQVLTLLGILLRDAVDLGLLLSAERDALHERRHH